MSDFWDGLKSLTDETKQTTTTTTNKQIHIHKKGNSQPSDALPSAIGIFEDAYRFLLPI